MKKTKTTKKKAVRKKKVAKKVVESAPEIAARPELTTRAPVVEPQDNKPISLNQDFQRVSNALNKIPGLSAKRKHELYSVLEKNFKKVPKAQVIQSLLSVQLEREF